MAAAAMTTAAVCGYFFMKRSRLGIDQDESGTDGNEYQPPRFQLPRDQARGERSGAAPALPPTPLPTPVPTPLPWEQLELEWQQTQLGKCLRTSLWSNDTIS